jgi:uncharacterized protein YkwD
VTGLAVHRGQFWSLPDAPAIGESARHAPLTVGRPAAAGSFTPWAPQPSAGTRRVDLEDAFLAIANPHRVSIGLPAWKRDTGGAVEYIALWKADDLALWQYLAHDQDPTKGPHAGTTIYDRFDANGYANQAWAENLAYGFDSAQSMFNAWMSDQGHRQNLESQGPLVGLAVVQAALNGLLFWALDVGWTHVPIGDPTPPDPGPTPRSLVIGERWTDANAVTAQITALPPNDRVTWGPVGKRGQLGKARHTVTATAFRNRFH